MNASERLPPGAASGIDERMIHALVHGFYARVRVDPELGPIFDRAIGDGWTDHLAKLCDFWSSVMLLTGRFRGAPMAVHAQIPQIEAGHFQRWLALFASTARQLCPPEAAALFITRSEMIARSLQLGIAASRELGSSLPTRGRAVRFPGEET